MQATCAAGSLSIGAAGDYPIALLSAGHDAGAEKKYRRSQDPVGDRAVIEHVALLRAWARRESLQTLREHLRRFLTQDSVPMPLQSDLLEVLDQPVAARMVLKQAFEDPANQDATRQFRISLWTTQFDDTDLALAAACRSYVELRSLSSASAVVAGILPDAPGRALQAAAARSRDRRLLAADGPPGRVRPTDER